jgi:DNA (cytosine-5)-methyltransferase 1
VAPTFRFVDLFAGIGGFHAALSAAGGECVCAVEIDKDASKVYERNWGISPLGDIRQLANDLRVDVPDHEILCAGFPCQPFSKSGAQKGMEEARGTLFYNIAHILRAKKPAIVVLENVRNLAGPRHTNDMRVIVDTLRQLGYLVSDEPSIISPHLLPPSLGGRPQNRERVFITGTYVGSQLAVKAAEVKPAITLKGAVEISSALGWSPELWNLDDHLLLPSNLHFSETGLSTDQLKWIEAWNEFVVDMLEIRGGQRLPGFPLWAQYWARRMPFLERESTPDWKLNFIEKNREFFLENRSYITAWRKKFRVWEFPVSRQKLEWQAQGAATLSECVLHFRPSGIRAKRATYLPALVAITQTSVIGSRQRKLTLLEAQRLQGLPDWFDLADQNVSRGFHQLGNGVSIGAVWMVLRKHIERDREIIAKLSPGLLDILTRGESPDPWLMGAPHEDRETQDVQRSA